MRKLLLSFMLVLVLLAVAVVAIGLNGDNSVQAQSQEQLVISVTPGSIGVDPGGGTSTLNDTYNTVVVTVTLTTFAFGEEGLGVVPAYHLIKPIAQPGSLDNRFDSVSSRVDDHSQTLAGVLPSSRVSHNTIAQHITPARINSVRSNSA